MNKNIILVIIIIILAGAVGYFALVQKPEVTPPDEIAVKEAVEEVVIGFLQAKQSRDFENAKPFLSSDFAETIDPMAFAGTSNPHTGRFDIQDIQLLSDGKTYKVDARVYQEYTGEGDIGYNNNSYYVKLFGDHYLIDNIEYGEYVELAKDENANWKIYRNEKYGFEFKYPKDSKLQEGTRFAFDLSVNLPFTPGTKLTDKRMSIFVKENSTSEDCFGLIKWHGITEINGIEFHYIPGYKWEHAMGGKSFFASDYFTMKNNNCIGLEFRLGLTDPTGFVDPSVPIPPDPPEEDLDTEVFDEILSTFKFLE